jgi:hypothetical protein
VSTKQTLTGRTRHRSMIISKLLFRGDEEVKLVLQVEVREVGEAVVCHGTGIHDELTRDVDITWWRDAKVEDLAELSSHTTVKHERVGEVENTIVITERQV